MRSSPKKSTSGPTDRRARKARAEDPELTIERMFETWERAKEYYRLLQGVVANPRVRTRDPAHHAEKAAELARIQRALLSLAKNGRGLGTLRIVCEQNVNAALSFFVQDVYRMMSSWDPATDPAVIAKNAPPVILESYRRTFGITVPRLLAILRSSEVTDERKLSGPKAAALKAAALVIRADPMTVRRRIAGIPKDARFMVRGIAHLPKGTPVPR